MGRSETFRFDIEPVAKGRPRFTRSGHAYTPAKTRDYEQQLRDLAVKFKCKPFKKAIAVKIIFYFTRPKSVKRLYHTVKPDADNLVKNLDSFNGVLYDDDAQIIEIIAEKKYADGVKPGIELTITAVEEE